MRAQSHGAIALSPEESSPEEGGLSDGVRTWNYGVQQYHCALHLKVKRVLSK